MNSELRLNFFLNELFFPRCTRRDLQVVTNYPTDNFPFAAALLKSRHTADDDMSLYTFCCFAANYWTCTPFIVVQFVTSKSLWIWWNIHDFSLRAIFARAVVRRLKCCKQIFSIHYRRQQRRRRSEVILSEISNTFLIFINLSILSTIIRQDLERHCCWHSHQTCK